MKFEKEKAIAISTGNHYAFKRYAEVLEISNIQIPHINKRSFIIVKFFELFKALLSIPRQYSLYFCESCFYYVVFLKKIGLIKGKIVNVCSSPIYYNLLNNRVGIFQKYFLLWLLKDVDFFVCQGKYVSEILDRLGLEDKPRIITYTFIHPSRIKQLKKIKPNLNSKIVCSIATNDWYYKGVDILLEAMKKVNEKDPQIKLKLVIRNIDLKPLQHIITKNVEITEDAVAALSDCSLYIHPARGDVFPVAPLEAMYIGIPVIVSKECGTKEFVKKNNIFLLNSDIIAEKVLSMIARGKKIRITIEERDILEKFKKDFLNALVALT